MPHTADPSTLTFAAADLLDALDALPLESLDALDFGLIVVDEEYDVIAYNRFESERAGIAPERVLGRNLFVTVAPCTNNYMVAERYHTGERLDEQLDYVFTFRMAPTPVRLRLMATPGAERRYLAIVAR